MNFLLKLILSALAVVIGAYIIPGVSVNGFISALIVAIVLGLLNASLKPLLVILTIPVTVITLGLFLLVINVIVIYVADWFVGGFHVTGFIPALLFSFVLTVLNWLFDSFLAKD